jgi:type I restriction enzyme R subunit
MRQDTTPITRYEPIALSNESSVVAEFVRPDEVREERYQSEAELGRDLIERLQVQAYEYLAPTSEADLGQDRLVLDTRLNPSKP